MAAPYPLRPGEQDCRDYLRTGRCKYGESCKYNHPLNVESGGGVKPTNPGEPLFPIRPLEPACQYFLKHGTCKFGQACKFNHPSGSPLAGDVCLPAGQLVFVTSNNNGITGTSSSSSLMQAASTNSSVQVLPQRPTEPNCIYFLRNGKCKYGATCKFHHPLDAINNNNNLIQQTATNNNERDRSYSISSAGSLERTQQMMQQQNISYAHVAGNVTYVQQQQQQPPLTPQRLQPITERARPQQATHVLLPDGQIAVILDSQSLQNVSELSAQDRPKFYQSQRDGSIGTLPSIDQPPQQVVIQSPMLTATTGSTSNHTFDSSIGDLMGTNVSYQVQGSQLQETSRSRGGQHGSGGSLSAYGSVDSGAQGDYTPVAGNMYHQQQQAMSTNNGQSHQSTSLQPQFSAWPLNESLNQSSNNQQAHRRPPSSAEAHDRQQRQAEDAAASYFWPSNGSFSSIPVNERSQQQQQGGQSYIRRPNASPTVSAQPMYQSQSNERGGTLSPSENSRRTQESSGDDQASLSMMTSALLTMMDPPSSNGEQTYQQHHPQSSLARRAVHQNDEIHTTTKSAPNIQGSPMRPPPGMTSPPSMANGGSSSASPRRSPPDSSGYFVGGY